MSKQNNPRWIKIDKIVDMKKFEVVDGKIYVTKEQFDQYLSLFPPQKRIVGMAYNGYPVIIKKED